MPRVKLFGIEVDNLNMDEAIEEIEKIILLNNGYKYVVTPNVDHIVKLQVESDFKNVYKDAALVLADGQPLVWASRILNCKLKEKVSGSDLFPILCSKAAEKGYKVFFLGGNLGVAAKAAEELTNKNLGLKVCGTYSPPYGFENDETENDKINKMLLKANPDILFVGLGAPKQENWIYNNKEKYKVAVSLGIGASFDFEAKTIKRAPRWVQNSGLEWFYRFTCEPKRLFKRYFIDDSKFIMIILKELLKNKNTNQHI